jgi:NAD(P)-dependent dehydrogenase (short-subunit alcohol dehydrogenase family)
MGSWKDQVVLVTGAGSGIGKALSLALARRGAKVTVTDIDGAAAERVAAECGAGARAAQLDVRDAAAVEREVQACVHAGGRIDVMVNNAGMGVGGETYQLEVAHFDRVLDVNVRGVVHGVMAAYPRMVKQGSGRIVNVASLAGLGPAPFLTAYSMSKHAVVGLSTSLRAEGAALGVRVNVLCPAAIETPLLDADNPSDLPKPPWRPDLRAFLTRLAGPPYPVDRLADDALAALARNESVIVLPGRARALWRLGRVAPWLVEKGSTDAVAEVRKRRG